MSLSLVVHSQVCTLIIFSHESHMTHVNMRKCLQNWTRCIWKMDSQKHLTCECSQAVSSIVLTITISHTNNSLISEQLAIMKVSKSGTKQINRQSTYRHLQCNLLPSSGSGWWWWWRWWRPQAQTCWSIVKAVLYTTSAAGVLPPQTFSHLRALWK